MKHSLTTGEIAEHCGVHYRTVTRWINRGQLKGYKLPGRGDSRVLVDDFLNFLRQNNMPIPKEFQPETAKALIIDDDSAMAQVIERVLRSMGLQTIVSTNSFQAGALLAAEEPAVMTLDINMPHLNGFDILKFVKRSEKINKTKILVISALPEKILKTALEYGAANYLEKPFDNTKLIEKIQSLLEN